ncbi:MAG: ATP-binding protein [Geobacteraceae bacterium]|nr:ATP-binding protein [Geobacteraceae bacterium]
MGRNTIELDIRVPNQTRYLRLIGRIGEALARELEEEGGGREALADQLNVVLTEAMSNAILHAHDDDPHKTVHISLAISDHELRIRVYDQGRGFDLDAVGEPDADGCGEHGRGLFIIRCMMDVVTYRRSKGFNVLEMWKKLR